MVPSLGKNFIDVNPSVPPARVKVVLLSKVEVPPRSTKILKSCPENGPITAPSELPL